MTRLEVAQLARGADGPGDDRVATFSHEGVVVLLVVDGAGGTGRGAQAAEMVLRCCGEQLRRTRPTPAATERALQRADTELFRTGDGGLAAAVVACVLDETVFGASVGDCGAWLVDAAHCTELTAGQAHKPLLGSAAATITTFEHHGRGTLLVASDGLLKYAARPRLLRAVREVDFPRLPEALVELVTLRSGRRPDDVGLALARWR